MPSRSSIPYLLLFAISCSERELTLEQGPDSAASAMTAVTPVHQVLRAGAVRHDTLIPPIVRLIGELGQPVADVLVRFEVLGGGTAAQTLRSSSHGYAGMRAWNLDRSGTDTVIASAGGLRVQFVVVTEPAAELASYDLIPTAPLSHTERLVFFADSVLEYQYPGHAASAVRYVQSGLQLRWSLNDNTKDYVGQATGRISGDTLQVDFQPYWEPQRYIKVAAGQTAAVGQFAFSACYEETFDGCRRAGISTINDDGSDERAVGPPLQDYFPVWSRDGKKIAFERDCEIPTNNCKGGLYVMNADASAISHLSTFLSQGPAGWAPDNRSIVFASRDGGLFIVDVPADGTGERQLVAPRVSEFSWSPDGSTIAFTGAGLQTIKPDGSGLVSLTTAKVHTTPTWSPDGTRIAYVPTAGSEASNFVHIINTDGTDVALPVKAYAHGRTLAWSPDGNRIAFTASGGVSIMNVDGTEVVGLGRGYAPVWSASGDRIAYVSSNYRGVVIAERYGWPSRTIPISYPLATTPFSWSSVGTRR